MDLFSLHLAPTIKNSVDSICGGGGDVGSSGGDSICCRGGHISAAPFHLGHHQTVALRRNSLSPLKPLHFRLLL